MTMVTSGIGSNEEIEKLRAELHQVSDRAAQGEALLHLYRTLIAATPGLERLLHRFLELTMEIYGGQNIIVYYHMDTQWYYRDIYKIVKEVQPQKVPLLSQAVKTGKRLHIINPGTASANAVRVGNTHTCIFPLQVNERVIGVVFMEGIIVFDEQTFGQLEIFFKYLALCLNNEILGHIKIQEAYGQLEQVFQSSPEGMMFLDMDFNIIRINHVLPSMLEMAEEQCIGIKCDELFNCPHADRKTCCEVSDLPGKRKQNEIEIISKSGETFYGICTLTPVKNKQGQVYGQIAHIVDITARKKAEEKIRQALVEKNTLLREIHHRVKNNLQVIYSLVKLQENNFKSKIADFPDCFKDMGTRIRTMGIIHEQLYCSSDFSRIDFLEYIKKFKVELLQLYQKWNVDITLQARQGEIPFLDIERAIPCGLITNELITNALKYAFPGDRKGEVTVRFYLDEDELYHLVVSDNGVGISTHCDGEPAPSDGVPTSCDEAPTSCDEGVGRSEIFNRDTLGLKLVKGLVRQLAGDVQVDETGGLSFHVTFPASDESVSDSEAL
ncbi:MAG: PAS domain-containing protein [bacterium]|nr:PAS domain-containing protein [bacterium]